MQEKTAVAAIVSMVLGILGVVTFFVLGGVCFGLPAVGMGLLALWQVSEAKGTLEGKTQAIIGSIAGAVGLLMSLGLAMAVLLLWPQATGFMGHRKEARCMDNMRQVGLAMMLYGDDHTGELPMDLATLTREGYAPGDEVFLCPAADPWNVNPDESELDTHYVYIGAGLTTNMEDAFLIPILYDQYSNHGDSGSINVLFLDGHVVKVNPNGKDFMTLCEVNGWTYPVGLESPDDEIDVGAIMELLNVVTPASPSPKSKTPEGEDKDGISHLDGMDLDF